jgi:hypothetical protein
MAIIGKFFNNIGIGFKKTHSLTKFVWQNKVLLIPMLIVLGSALFFTPVHFLKVSNGIKALAPFLQLACSYLAMVTFIICAKKIFAHEKITVAKVVKETVRVAKTSSFWITIFVLYIFTMIGLNIKSNMFSFIGSTAGTMLAFSILTHIVYEKMNMKKCWLFIKQYFTQTLGTYLYFGATLLVLVTIPVLFMICWKVLLGIIPNLSIITNPKVVKIVMLSSFGIVALSVFLIIGAAFYAFFAKNYKEFLEKN